MLGDTTSRLSLQPGIKSSDNQITYFIELDMSYPQNHNELRQAIEHGDTDRFKQLIDSGISLNTILHSPVRREHATVLGTAAYEGKVEIITYLITAKVMLNYQDPCLSRNALHWAAIGGQYESAELLVKSGINVNCKDRDNVTPVIRAAIKGKKEIVELLVNYGANVNQFDRLHSSPLHYASFHGKSDVVTLLIQAGCIPNNPAIFGQGTPLANLVYHGDIKNCKMLVDSGYDLRKDTWILQYDFSHEFDCDNNIGDFLLNQFKNPCSLVKLCRWCIRQQFNGIKVSTKTKQLPLPSKMILFLLLKDY